MGKGTEFSTFTRVRALISNLRKWHKMAADLESLAEPWQWHRIDDSDSFRFDTIHNKIYHWTLDQPFAGAGLNIESIIAYNRFRFSHSTSIINFWLSRRVRRRSVHMFSSKYCISIAMNVSASLASVNKSIRLIPFHTKMNNDEWLWSRLRACVCVKEWRWNRAIFTFSNHHMAMCDLVILLFRIRLWLSKRKSGRFFVSCQTKYGDGVWKHHSLDTLFVSVLESVDGSHSSHQMTSIPLPRPHSPHK